jgi:hypothetical protein
MSAVTSASADQKDSDDEGPVRPFSRIAVEATTGSLGFGGQVATQLRRDLNLRAGAAFFDFSDVFGSGAAVYQGQAHLKSGHVTVDWFPFRNGFHVSPGIIFFESSFYAAVNVAPNGAFDMGDLTFISSSTDPVYGSASLSFGRSVLPSLTVGFANMMERKSRRWSVPVEVGLAYTGHYTVQYDLQGSACFYSTGCVSTSNPTIHQSIVQEQDMLNETMKRYQIYPIITSGFAYRF